MIVIRIKILSSLNQVQTNTSQIPADNEIGILFEGYG